MLLGVNPFHHAAKLLAGFFDRVVSLTTLNGLKAGLIRLVLQDPFLGKLTGLNFLEDFFHFRLGLIGHNTWSPRVVAKLGGIGDAVTHVI